MTGKIEATSVAEIRGDNMYLAVYLFNGSRNNFAYDGNNERKMWESEKKEFYEATTLAERVDAITDCKFVSMGTQMKMDANGVSGSPYNADLYLMENIVREEIQGSNSNHRKFDCHDDKYDKIMAKAELIVCQCNELKTKKLDENGKVIKQDSLPDATLLIEKMISKVLSDD